MTDKRIELIDRMIRIYGFEHAVVIDFCKKCENLANNDWNDICLEILVKAHEDSPLSDDEKI